MTQTVCVWCEAPRVRGFFGPLRTPIKTPWGTICDDLCADCEREFADLCAEGEAR